MAHVKFLALGGFGTVTQNMYVYEYENEMLIVDCGIGFPNSYMPGVDLLIPDISYVVQQVEQGKKLVGIALTHGHDDHIAALPYLYPHLPQVPIYGSPLTAAFAEQRLVDGGASVSVTAVHDLEKVQFGEHFAVQWVPITHSIPDTRHLIIHTPQGIMYHGSDFKLDPNPVDGATSDLKTVSQLQDQPVMCMLIDCLRSETASWVGSETLVGPEILTTMRATKGKYVVTLMSSHIHRIQQVVDAAKVCGRKVAFIGRSVEQNVDISLRLGKLHIDALQMIDKKEISNARDSELCVVVAGSQGQEGSSLVRAIFGEHPMLKISPEDMVVFSADVIPGNETNYYGAIDELARTGVEVIYPDVLPGIHQSGHASAPEQKELIGLVKPQLLLPIGGNERHRVRFTYHVAADMGYGTDKVVLPETGQIIEFTAPGQYHVADVVSLRPQIVDGLGVGDVGPSVLSDRRALGQAGIVVVVIPKTKKGYDARGISVVSRGFVFMKDAGEVIDFITRTTAEVLATQPTGKKVQEDSLKRTIEKKLQRKLYKVIQREPMVVAVFVDSISS